MTNPDVTRTLDWAYLDQFDMIIDVRSPAEFAQDHIPGAVNLPVLDDAERARVGTVYVQESRFLARRIGAALVARNISRHLETALADKPPGFRPLIYCWRGGQRSNAMALVLAQVGWRTLVLSGGYKTWRRTVQEALYTGELGYRFVLLDGGTGSAKTDILARAAALGAQTLDLEGLARHRGSLFGALVGTPQPSQKWFESCLYDQLRRMDPGRPVILEAESSKVGNRTLPPAFWQAMMRAPRVELRAPLEARISYLLSAYPDVIANRNLLENVLSRLEIYPGRKQLAAWRSLADAGLFHDLARELVERHYDPSYARSARSETRPLLAAIELGSLEEAERDRAAMRLLAVSDAL